MKIENAIQLKQYIYNNDMIETVLEAIGCNHIKHNNEYYTCSNPDGDNPTAVHIRNNEVLSMKNWTRNNKFASNADILSLVEYAKGFKKFSKTIKYVCELLGLEYVYFTNKSYKKRWNSKQNAIKDGDNIIYHKKFDKISNEKNISEKIKPKADKIPNEKQLEKILETYEPMLYIEWYREGIMPWTRKKFDIRYSYSKNSIIIPIRHWKTGKLLAFSSRTTIENYELLGFAKYVVTEGYEKSLNIFGLYENYESIQKAGYVILWEGEKSVFKTDSLNESTGVALQGKSISEEQARILIGLNVDIIISLDNDTDVNESRFIAEKFYNIRNVYYIKDKWDLLGERDSACDKGNKIFKFLFKYKIKYDKIEHEKFIDLLRNK